MNMTLVEFDINIFNNLDNYTEKRNYFEKHYKIMKKNNLLYRVRRINVQDIVKVSKKGLKDLYYKELNSEGEMEQKSFMKKYDTDQDKKTYSSIQHMKTCS